MTENLALGEEGRRETQSEREIERDRRTVKMNFV